MDPSQTRVLVSVCVLRAHERDVVESVALGRSRFRSVVATEESDALPVTGLPYNVTDTSSTVLI